MRRFTVCSIPAALALAVLTAHPESANSQASLGSTTTTEQRSSATTPDKQSQLTQEQRNQQSTFDPQRVSDSELKKSVNDVNKASSFMGMAIQNMQNEKLGTVKDLVFDPESGKISYAVLSVGGFLGVGDKLVAVPLKSLRPQPGEKYLVLNMTRDELKNAPGLAKNNWPHLNDPALGSPASAEQSSASSSSASESAGRNSSTTSSSSSPSSSNSSSESTSDKTRDHQSSDQLSTPPSASKDAQESTTSPTQSSDTSKSSKVNDATKDAQGSSPSTTGGNSSSDTGETTKNSGKDSDSTPNGDSSQPKATRTRFERLSSFPHRLIA